MRRDRQLCWTIPFLFLFGGTACLAPSKHAADSAMNPTSTGPADTIVVNAKVWTGDPSALAAEAFAVRDGHFIAVGTTAEVEALAGPATERIDASGQRIIPGLIDAHLHLIGGGLSLSRLALRDVRDRDAFIDAVRRRAAKLRPGQWLLGRGWSTESWPDTAQPNRAWIDPFTADIPVLLYRMDGHGALANTAALRLAGLDVENPPSPLGGEVELDPTTRRPTGILKESATDLVQRLIPQPDVNDRMAAVRAAMYHANEAGLTTVCTMSEWDEVEAVRRVHDSGKDTLRVAYYVSESNWADYVARATAFPVRDDRLWIAGFKAFMDGSLGSRTAYMHEPFTDKHPVRGLLTDTMLIPGRMADNFRAADKAGLQCAVHAIGDEANHLLLDLYEALAKERGPRDRRPRIEHAQHLLPADIGRFASLGVVASMQPYHKADDARYAETAIGHERCETSYAFADLERSGARLAFGSDWPVVTLDPFAGMQTAVTGRTVGGWPWMPQQNITIEQALTAYTVGGAYACGKEDRLGRIAKGYCADFVRLGQDVLAVPAADVWKTVVRETYVGGKLVWQPPPPSAHDAVER